MGAILDLGCPSVRHNFVYAQYLEKFFIESNKFSMCIYIDMIYHDIVTHNFWNICTRVMALHVRRNFVSAQYLEKYLTYSDFIWPFLRPYMGVIPNPKMTFIFPISCILALIFPILIKYFPNCEGKDSFLKSQIKSLTYFHQILYMDSY